MGTFPTWCLDDNKDIGGHEATCTTSSLPPPWSADRTRHSKDTAGETTSWPNMSS